MGVVNWNKLWGDFDEWHKGRYSDGTWEGQKAAIERLAEEQLSEASPEMPGFEGTRKDLNNLIKVRG